MNYGLKFRTKLVRVMNAVAAGTSDQNSSSVDMAQDAGFRGVRFMALFGTLTATQVTQIKVQGSDDNSSWSDLTGTNVGPMADADSNKMLVVDVYRPVHRYVRCVVDRGTANAVIDGVVAELYDPNACATSTDTTVSATEAHVSPAAGTA